jgi:hypothetical protein
VLQQALLILAQAEHEAEETSKAAFYIAGGVLAAFAVIISIIGIRGHDWFPRTRGAMTGAIGLCALLVAATMATAIITA